MRCVDDSLLHHFLSTYEGYSMPVDAIIALIGTSLGAEQVFVRPLTVNPENYKELSIENQPYGNIGFRVRSPRHPSPKGNGGIGKAETQQGLGVELPPLKSPEVPKEWGRNVILSKSLGSGFRTKTDFKRNYTSPVKKIDKEPLKLMTTSKTTEELIDEYGDFNRISRKKLFDRKNDEVHTNFTLSISTTDMEADKAINVIRNQLLEEGYLPSTQPEKILTDEQLHRIGSAPNNKNRITDLIINQKLDKKIIHRMNSQNMNNTNHIKYDDKINLSSYHSISNNDMNNLTIGSKFDNVVHKAKVTEAIDITMPKAIKTNNTTSPVYLYNTIAEQARFLGANVASGAGLSLWKDRQQLLHEQKYSKRKGTNINSIAVQKLHVQDVNRKTPMIL